MTTPTPVPPPTPTVSIPAPPPVPENHTFRTGLRRFSLRLLVNLAVALFIAVCALGYSPYTNELSFGSGFDALMTVFGGLTSFGFVLLAVLGFAIGLLGPWWLSTRIYSPEERLVQGIHVFCVAILVIVAAVGCVLLFRQATLAGWIVAGALALVVLQTAFNAARRW